MSGQSNDVQMYMEVSRLEREIENFRQATQELSQERGQLADHIQHNTPILENDRIRLEKSAETHRQQLVQLSPLQEEVRKLEKELIAQKKQSLGTWRDGTLVRAMARDFYRTFRALDIYAEQWRDMLAADEEELLELAGTLSGHPDAKNSLDAKDDVKSIDWRSWEVMPDMFRFFEKNDVLHLVESGLTDQAGRPGARSAAREENAQEA